MKKDKAKTNKPTRNKSALEKMVEAEMERLNNLNTFLNDIASRGKK